MPEEITVALIQAGTLIIGALAAYIANKIYDRQKLIGRSVEHSNDQNETLCTMIKANTKLCEEIAAQLKAQEKTNAKTGAH
jgi:hypothetical protein